MPELKRIAAAIGSLWTDPDIILAALTVLVVAAISFCMCCI
jgi:hypothetical protein